MKKLMLISIVATLSAGTAFAANLSGDARITRELTAAAVADEIRNKCSSLSANMVVVLQKMYSLKSHAKSLGATDSEIKEFLESKTEQQRIQGLRNAYLAENGATSGNNASYCELGEREKAQGTLIGSLLK